MTATLSDSTLTPRSPGFSELKAALVEPALVVGAALFWLAALPFVALSLLCVKIWDTLLALNLAAAVRPSALILRRGPVKTARATHSSARTAQI